MNLLKFKSITFNDDFIKKEKIILFTLAIIDDLGSSNNCHIIVIKRLRLDKCPAVIKSKSSSQPNFLIISSLVDRTVSNSNESSTCNVACVDRYLV
jgi:hypothetical protein